MNGLILFIEMMAFDEQGDGFWGSGRVHEMQRGDTFVSPFSPETLRQSMRKTKFRLRNRIPNNGFSNAGEGIFRDPKQRRVIIRKCADL